MGEINVGIPQSRKTMEFRRWWMGREQRLLWLQSPTQERQSLPHCAQQNVEAGLSVWD